MKPNLVARYLLAAGFLIYPAVYGQIDSPDFLPADDSSEVNQDSLLASLTDSLKNQKPAKIIIPAKKYYNVDDSVVAYFLTPRTNLREEAIRSFQHDAGDYLRFNTSNFTIEDQSTPHRKTVAPFALPGNRLNIIFNDRALNPLEHLPEPDNQIDFSDIPTAPVKDIYNIEGPLGLALGGGNGTSSLIMIPPQPDTTRAESEVAVDKGSFDYAYTKARFIHRSLNGRSIRGAVDYRKATGGFFFRNDDSYHQWGELILPITPELKLNLNGRLYQRSGTYNLRPDIPGFMPDRNRMDRDLVAGMSYYHSSVRTSSIEFRHQRSESRLSVYEGGYYRSLDILNNRITFAHDFRIDSLGVRMGLTLIQENYNDGDSRFKRRDGFIDLKVIRQNNVGSLLGYLKLEKESGFNLMPTVAFAYLESHPNFYFSGSLGYCTKFPRQYELNLTPRLDHIIDANNSDYYESGNLGLAPEKQLVGNLSIGSGKSGSDIMLSITGGKIFDGIDWQRAMMGQSVRTFRTGNNNITFATATLKQRLTGGNCWHWSGGGSYHYVEIDDDAQPPYTPEFQAFSGLEIYQYVRFLDLHLYAYMEAIYNSRYHGYLGRELGEKPIANLKLSFRIKSFRFYYIFQNLLSVEYQSREDFTISGRYNFWGLTWDFLD